MKKLALALLLLAKLAPAAAFAGTDKNDRGDTIPSECQIPPDHGMYGHDGLDTPLGCITKADWDKPMPNQNTVGAVDLTKFAPGTSITDEHGIVYECSAMVVTDTNCVNMTGTQWYIDDMNGIAQALIA